jgi:KDO2-lipid IV(A) lauroyltransferase
VHARLGVRTSHRLAALGGNLEWALRPGKRANLRTNLAHALARDPDDPLVRATVRREFVNEAYRSADFLWSVAAPDEVVARTELVPGDRLEAALAAGRGAILASGHIGGWEVVTAMSRTLGVRVTAIVDHDWIARAVMGVREHAGLDLLPNDRSPRQALRSLAAGGVVVVLFDQPKLWMRCHTVRLLDGEVALPSGPAGLSRLGQAPLVPFAVLPSGPRRWRIELHEPIPPPPRHGGRAAEQETSQVLADALSRILRAHPEHWAAVDPMPWRNGAGPGA